MASGKPIRIAFHYPKGGVGKTTGSVMLSLLFAKAGKRVLMVDGDPEAGMTTSVIGKAARSIQPNLRSFLESPGTPPPVIGAGVPNLSLLPCKEKDFADDEFYRHFDNHSLLLRDGLDLIEHDFDVIVVDVANQYNNLACLCLAAVDFHIMPVELKADCADRSHMALDILGEAKTINPGLATIGVLSLADAPYARTKPSIPPSQAPFFRHYADVLGSNDIRLFETIMYKSANTVESARASLNLRSMHYTARRRFEAFHAEVIARIKALSLPTSTHERRHAHASRTAA